MPIQSETESQQQTRERLLESAAKVFSEKGFQAATIREICRDAEANVAAVHYHFGDKRQLYASALGVYFQRAMQKYPPDWQLPDNPTPRDKIRSFVRSLLYRTLDPKEPDWHGQLLIREMAEPTGILEHFVDQAIRPNFEILQSIIIELLGKGVDEKRLRLIALSIVGQCIFHRVARPMLNALIPQQNYSEEALEQITEHITQFTMAALTSECKSDTDT